MPELKNLFDTPKKARTAILCALVALATLAALAVYAGYALKNPPPEQSEATSAPPEDTAGPEASEEPAPSAVVGLVPALTIDEARALALADAGVAEEEAEVSREALAESNGLWVYEFRFQTASARYEYQINANTGAVRTKVKESFAAPAGSEPPVQSSPAVQAPASAALAASAPPARPSPTQPPVQSAPASGVDLEQAKRAALADAGVAAAQAVFTKTEPDYEDGAPVYDIEFYTSTHAYEYEIAAATGAVLSRSAQALQTAQPSSGPAPGSGSYIGADRAKAIALERAGLSGDQAVFTHVRMDREDGRTVYEIEFRQGRVEYECTVDAATGRVLEYETDAD